MAEAKLREFLKDRQMTQADLANALGMTRQHVNGIINGKRPLTSSFIGKFGSQYGWDTAGRILGANGHHEKA